MAGGPGQSPELGNTSNHKVINTGLSLTELRKKYNPIRRQSGKRLQELNPEINTNSDKFKSARRAFAKDIARGQIKAEIAEKNSMYDKLTNLHNRRWFDEELERRVKEAQRTGRKLWLIYFDLDKFKHINSRYGHPGGDKILKAAARIPTRAEEPIARLGGEEFAQLTSEIANERDVSMVMTRYMHQLMKNTSEVLPSLPLQKRYRDTHRIPYMTMSFGAVEYNGEEPEEFLRKANDAMLHAKIQGRDRGYIAKTLEGQTVFDPIVKKAA